MYNTNKRYLLGVGFVQESLVNFLEKWWLKRRSVPIMCILLIVLFLALTTTFDGWDWIDVPTWVYTLSGALFFGVGVAYLIMCLYHDHLPRGPKGELSVLFCIDAESKHLYEMAKFKLVDQFNMQVDNGKRVVHALPVSKAQIAKYNLQDPESALSLLEDTNSVLIVYVRYMADDIDNAENFELRINCGVSHPKFSEKVEAIISQDLRTMKKSVSRQRFNKSNSFAVFNLTAQTLLCAVQYILGFVYLLSDDNRHALELLLRSKKNLPVGQVSSLESKRMSELVDDRIYLALCQLGQECLSGFHTDNSLEHLVILSQLLEKANMIRPETYFYNMNMAFVHVALNRDARAAKACIENCKSSKENKEWLYSDAFLSAYCGHAPTTILSKYSKAFKVPYKSLVEIVEYIEFVIEAEPAKTALHLAAGLVYEEMEDVKLMRQHLSTFLSSGKNINKKTRDLIEGKIAAGQCGVQCNHDCIKCAS